MSRIGKRPIEAPNGVEFKISGQTIDGQQGTERYPVIHGDR